MSSVQTMLILTSNALAMYVGGWIKADRDDQPRPGRTVLHRISTTRLLQSLKTMHR